MFSQIHDFFLPSIFIFLVILVFFIFLGGNCEICKLHAVLTPEENLQQLLTLRYSLYPLYNIIDQINIISYMEIFDQTIIFHCQKLKTSEVYVFVFFFNIRFLLRFFDKQVFHRPGDVRLPGSAVILTSPALSHNEFYLSIPIVLSYEWLMEYVIQCFRLVI